MKKAEKIKIVKALSILGIAAALGEKVRVGAQSDVHVWRGQKLQEAGFQATKMYNARLTSTMVKHIYNKTYRILGNDRNNIKTSIVEGLAFINCGLIDLWSESEDKYKPFLDPVITRAAWVQQLYDPGFKKTKLHNQGFDRYERWA